MPLTRLMMVIAVVAFLCALVVCFCSVAVCVKNNGSAYNIYVTELIKNKYGQWQAEVQAKTGDTRIQA